MSRPSPLETSISAGVEISLPREEAFRIRFEPVRARLYSFIRKAMNFSPDADDVFQDTALNALRYFESCRRDGEFAAWIFGIAHNEIRKVRKIPRLLPLKDSATIPEDFSRRQLVRSVFDRAARLSPRRRTVFFLYYDSGFSIPEIARITGLGQGNVKFILNRVRRDLRRFFGETP